MTKSRKPWWANSFMMCQRIGSAADIDERLGAVFGFLAQTGAEAAAEKHHFHRLPSFPDQSKLLNGTPADVGDLKTMVLFPTAPGSRP